MKKVWVFILGAIVGAIISLSVVFIVDRIEEARFEEEGGYLDTGISLFNGPGDAVPYKTLKVFQVLPNGSALALATKLAYPQDYDFIGESVVLILPHEKSSYYDGKMIRLPAGNVFRQIGTYRYKNKEEFIKTVPIIAYYNK